LDLVIAEVLQLLRHLALRRYQVIFAHLRVLQQLVRWLVDPYEELPAITLDLVSGRAVDEYVRRAVDEHWLLRVLVRWVRMLELLRLTRNHFLGL